MLTFAMIKNFFLIGETLYYSFSSDIDKINKMREKIRIEPIEIEKCLLK